MSLHLIKTRLNFTSNYLDHSKILCNISARMSWSISEILKPFKKLAVIQCILPGLKTWGKAKSF